MKRNFDLLAVDIDGTLVDHTMVISKKVKGALKDAKAAGVKIVLCTGRPFPGAKHYIEELGLNQPGDYIINYHGATVQKTDTNDMLIHHEITQADYEALNAWAEELGIYIAAVKNDGFYTYWTTLDHHKTFEPYANQMTLKIRTYEEIIAAAPFTKVTFEADANILDQALNNIPKSLDGRYTLLRSEHNRLEIIQKRASKGQTVKELAALLEIPIDRVMSIGDSGNDIDLVSEAGFGVAMGNAVREVKAAADTVTDPVDQDGAAKAIYQFLLSSK